MTRNISFSWGYVMVSCSASNSDTLGKLLNVHFPLCRLWKSNYVPRNVTPFFMLQWAHFRGTVTLLPSSFFSSLHRGLSGLRLSWLSNPFLFTHVFMHHIRRKKSQSSTWQKKGDVQPPLTVANIDHSEQRKMGYVVLRPQQIRKLRS